MANKKNSGYAVGIDLGTTYSCIAVWREDQQRAEIIPNEQGHRITPSCVAFKNGRWLIGEPAVNVADRNLTNTIYDVKRLIGRRYSDPSIQNDVKMWPFKVIGENDKPMIVVTEGETRKHLSAEDISAMILKKMCEYAETFLGSPVKDVVITVPAYFNDSQRQATKEAGASAGLNVVRIINEPSAAALAYGADKRANCVDEERNVFIFDLGGGTFDVSLVNVRDGIYDVKAKAGNNHLGGEDLVANMASHFMKEFNKESNMDMSRDPKALKNLRDKCEKAKIILSNDVEAHVDIDFESKRFHSRITRGRFEELNKKYFGECMEIVERCLEDAKMDKSSVDDVVLVGGSSRIPKLQELLRGFFKGKKLQRTINPDEAVAHGAAVQAAMLSGIVTRGPVVVLFDVTPLSLGKAIQGDIMSVMIPRNTPYPVENKRRYTTVADNQKLIVQRIYEGERKRASDNRFLGLFKFTGLTPAPRGYPIVTCFRIDEDGILHVSVEEKKAGRVEMKIDKARLSNIEITKLITEGRVREEEDNKFLEKAIAINDLKKQVYYMKATLKKMNTMDARRVSRNDKKNITSAIAKAKKFLGGNLDKENLKAVNDCLKAVKKVYDPIKRRIG